MVRGEPGTLRWRRDRRYPPVVRVFRAVHVGIAVVELTSLGYIWFSAMTRRRDPLLALAVGTLGVEGLGLIVGRGNCPLGPFQRRLGDHVPMFELFLPRRAATLAVPVLAAVSVAGVVAVALRRPVPVEHHIAASGTRNVAALHKDERNNEACQEDQQHRDSRCQGEGPDQ